MCEKIRSAHSDVPQRKTFSRTTPPALDNCMTTRTASCLLFPIHRQKSTCPLCGSLAWCGISRTNRRISNKEFRILKETGCDVRIGLQLTTRKRVFGFPLAFVSFRVFFVATAQCPLQHSTFLVRYSAVPDPLLISADQAAREGQLV